MKMNTNMVTMTCEDIRKMQEKYSEIGMTVFMPIFFLPNLH